MNRRTILLETLISHSVWLNQLLIPIKSVESTVARYTHSLIAINDDDTFPISLVGSSVAVKYRGRYLVLCTRHQLKDWDLERIALLTKDGKHAITSGGVRHFEKLNETDFHDLAAFDFTSPCRELSFFSEYFFDMKELPPDAPSDQIVCLIASGYPFGDQNFDLENERQLGQAKRIVLCTPDGPKQPKDEALMRLRALDRLSFDPDGMSGGGVFVVQMVDREPRAYFAGTIARAGPEHFHMVKAPFVRRFIDMWVQMSAKSE
jgi:hypothetical protein